MDKILLDFLREIGYGKEEIERLTTLFKKSGDPLYHILIRRGIKHEDIARYVTSLYGLPFLYLTPSDLKTELVRPFALSFFKENKVLPFNIKEKRLYIASFGPPPDEVVSSLFSQYLSLYDDIEDVSVYIILESNFYELISYLESYKNIKTESLSEEKVEEIVDRIILQAIEERASDIHFETFKDRFSLRFRIDGILYDREMPYYNQRAEIIGRIKVLAGLDIAETRRPQDGSILRNIKGKEVDVRVSVLPTYYGESVNLRILEKGRLMYGLSEIGFLEDTMELVQKVLSRPYGIILVTGPTGSGKTTTLYTFLEELNIPERKIITLEDPVEYEIFGINQIQIYPEIGLTFAEGLRRVLRHDPDILMVGEIRDPETADVAINAALTGHLVFSTLHTNDAPGAITRLIDMGVEPFLLSSSLIGVIAQRLVRKLCPTCPSDSPYKGRTGIFEFLYIDDEIREEIHKKSPTNIIREIARKKGMRSLWEDGIIKVERGITTEDELVRVLGK